MSDKIFGDLPLDSAITKDEDYKDFKQSQELYKEKYKIQNRSYKIQLKSRRVRWARRIFIAIFVYIITILCIFVFIGLSWLEYDASVVNVFLGTTSIHIIGLAYVVAKWLFPHRKQDSKINI